MFYGWLNDGFLSRICWVSWLSGSQLWHQTRVWLAILKKILGFPSWLIPWFLLTGRGSLPCDARVYGASLGDTCARSIVLSVSPCAPGVSDLLLTHEWRGRHWELPLVHIPAGWCHHGPTDLIVHWNHRISWLCLPLRFPSPQGNPRLLLWRRWMGGCVQWWESGICVSHLVILFEWPAICARLWTTYPS